MKKSTKKILTFVLASMWVGAGAGSIATYADMRVNETAVATAAAVTQSLDSSTAMSVQGQATLAKYTNVKIDFGKKINDGSKWLNFNNYAELGDKLQIWYNGAWQSFNALYNGNSSQISAILYDSYIDLQVDRRFIPALELKVKIEGFTVEYKGVTYELSETKAYEVTIKKDVAVEGSEHLTMVTSAVKTEKDLKFSAWQIKATETKEDNVGYTPFEVKLSDNFATGYETTALKNKLLYLNDYVLMTKGNAQYTLTDIRLSDYDQSVYGEVSVRNDGTYLLVYISNAWADVNTWVKTDGKWQFDLTLKKGFTYVGADGNIYKTKADQRLEIYQGAPYSYQGTVEITNFQDKTPKNRGTGDYVYELTLNKSVSGTEMQKVMRGLSLTMTSYATNGDKTDTPISWDYNVSGKQVVIRTVSGNKITIKLNDYFRGYDVALTVAEDARMYFDTKGSEPDTNYNDTFAWELLPYETQLKAAEWEINYYADAGEEKPISTLIFDSNSNDFAGTNSVAERFKTTEKALPTKVGYLFDMWTLAEGVAVPNGKHYGDLDIYPAWNPILYKMVVKVEYEGDEESWFPDKTYELTFDNIDNNDVDTLEEAWTKLRGLVVNQGDVLTASEGESRNQVGLTDWDAKGNTSLKADAWFTYDTAQLIKADFSDEALKDFEESWIYNEEAGAYVRSFTITASKQSYKIHLDYYGKMADKKNETLTVKWGEKIDIPNPEEMIRTSEAAYLEDDGKGFWVDTAWLNTLTYEDWVNADNASVCLDYVWADDDLFYVNAQECAVGDISLRAMWTPKVFTVTHQFNLDGELQEDRTDSFDVVIEPWFGYVRTLDDVTMNDANNTPVLTEKALTVLNKKLAEYVPEENAVDEADGNKWHDKFLYADYAVETLTRNDLLGELTYTVTTERKTYTVSYKNLGKEISGDKYKTKSYEWGTQVGLPQGLSGREGYTFIGWRDSADTSDPEKLWKTGQRYTVPVAKDTLFEAIWQLNVYEVTLHNVSLTDGVYAYNEETTPIVLKFSIFNQNELNHFDNSMGEWTRLPNNCSSAEELLARESVEQVIYLTYMPNPVAKIVDEVTYRYTYVWTKLDAEGNVAETYWENDTYLELMPDLNFALSNASYKAIQIDSVDHNLQKDLGNGTLDERMAATWEYADLGMLSAQQGKAFAGWNITYYYGKNVKINFTLNYENSEWTDEAGNTLDGAYIYIPATNVEVTSTWLLYWNTLTVKYDCDCNDCEALGANSHPDTVYYYGIENGTGLEGKTVYNKDGIQSLIEENHRPTNSDGKYTYTWGTFSNDNEYKIDEDAGMLTNLPFANSTNEVMYRRQFSITLIKREIEYTVNFYWYDGYVTSAADIFDTLVDLPTNIPAREGYTFSHWEDENGATLTNQVMIPVGGTTVYAVWDMVEYTFLVLDADGNELCNEVKTVLDYADSTKMQRLLASRLPANTAEYTYAWDVAVPTSFTARNYTFNVVKTPVKYTLKVGDKAAQVVAFGSEIGEYLKKPAQLAGKTFGGWVTPDGVEFDENSTMPAYNCVLVATWNLTVYKITVNYPDGTKDVISFAIEEDAANDVVDRKEALTLLKGMLPETSDTATYSWEEKLPAMLSFKDYQFTIKEHKQVIDKTDDSSDNNPQGGFTAIVASCKGCGSVASGFVGGFTVLGAAFVALLRKKED